MSRVRENRTHGSKGGSWKRGGAAKARGDGRPWETAGMCATPTACTSYRASSLPDHYHCKRGVRHQFLGLEDSVASRASTGLFGIKGAPKLGWYPERKLPVLG